MVVFHGLTEQQDDIRRPVMRLKNGKAEGSDGSMSELMKTRGETGVECKWKACENMDKSFTR